MLRLKHPLLCIPSALPSAKNRGVLSKDVALGKNSPKAMSSYMDLYNEGCILVRKNSLPKAKVKFLEALESAKFHKNTKRIDLFEKEIQNVDELMNSQRAESIKQKIKLVGVFVFGLISGAFIDSYGDEFFAGKNK